MRDLRRRRGWICSGLVAALLFMQLAVAAHACPLPLRATPGGIAETAAMAAMADCPHQRAAVPEPDSATLCKAHCEAGLQSVNSQAGALDAPPVLALPAALLGSVVVGEAVQGLLHPEALATGPPARRTPIYISFLVLRN